MDAPSRRRLPGLAVAALCAALATAFPVGAAGEDLTLRDALALARQRAPERAAAAAVVAGARDAARFAGPLPDPSLELSMENWRPSASDFAASRDLDVFAVLTQPLPIWGERGALQRRAGAERDGAVAVLAATDRDLTLQTARLYLSALVAGDVAGALEAQRDELVALARAVRRRFEEGAAAEADALKLQAEVARVAAELLRQRIAADRAGSALAALLDEPVGPDRLAWPDAVPLPAGEADALAREALTALPEVAGARARLAAARQTAALERARGRPTPAIAAGYKRTAGLDTVILGVTVDVPLFDRNRPARARAGAEQRRAELELEAVRRRLAGATASLIRTARALREGVASQEAERLAPAEAVRRAARSAFAEGAGDVLQLVDAERVYAEARRDAAELRLESLVVALAARLALGEEALP